MKKTLALLGVLAMNFTYAQEGRVGINVENPTATLHVSVPKNYTNGNPAGIAPVTLTGDQIEAMVTSNLGKGTFVFATTISTKTTDKTIDTIGYWFWNGTQWQKLTNDNISSLYTADGSITNVTNNVRTITLPQGVESINFRRANGVDNNNPLLVVNGGIKATALDYNSDKRLKTSIKNIENSHIQSLRPVSYLWNEEGKAKGGNDQIQYGFIAQEVELYYPELVNTDDKGYKSVNYSALISILIKELQEQRKEIDTLKKALQNKK